jgi:signal transduction histidine kinase/CheY-like chemotaxis protein
VGLLAGGTGLSAGLKKYSYHAAVWVLLGGIFASTLFLGQVYRADALTFYFALPVLLAGILGGAGLTLIWGILASAAAFFLMGQTQPVFSGTGALAPVGLIWLTAGAAWLAARVQNTALAWAWNSFQQARQKTLAAQEDRAELHRTLKELNKVQYRLERLNKELEMARETAEEAERFKAQFVANVSHELRTPLNLISGFAEMIAFAPQSYGHAALPPAYRADVMAIYRSSRHLLNLVDDVLDLSRLESGHLGILREKTGLAEILGEVDSMIRGVIESKGLAFAVDIPPGLPEISVDRTRIRQVILNLLNNALRFTEQGAITLKAEAAPPFLVVSVMDTGPGIPEDKLARVFDQFYQVDGSTTRKHSGVGLGLAISKMFIELHGGKIWVESQPSQTAFSFTLPAHGTAGAGLPARPQWDRPRDVAIDPTVLVFSADTALTRFLGRYLEGVVLEQAGTLESALAAAARLLPDVIICDAPEKIRQLKHRQRVARLPRPPALVYCPLSSSEQLARSFGAQGLLSKPITLHSLQETLGRLETAPQNVLIVEDERPMWKLLTRMLKAINPAMSIRVAAGEAQALDLITQAAPDVLFLDIYLETGDGLSLLHRLRQQASLAALPVIIITGASIDDARPPLSEEFQWGKPGGFTPVEIIHFLQWLLQGAVQGPGGPGHPANLAG